MSDRAVEAMSVGTSVTHDMSVWGLFMQADWVVKTVIIILVLASIWSWGIIFEKLRGRRIIPHNLVAYV